MRWITTFMMIITMMGAGAFAQEFSFHAESEYLDLLRDGRPFLRTMTPTYDPDNREPTYKVYTHIFDPEGEQPITKDHVGLFCHHRGLYIGWSKTQVTDADTGEMEEYDTWHMGNCHQAHHSWRGFGLGGEGNDSMTFHLVASQEETMALINQMNEHLHGAVDALLLPAREGEGPRLLRSNIDGFRHLVREAKRQQGIEPEDYVFSYRKTGETHQHEEDIFEILLIESKPRMTAEGMVLRAVAERESPQWSVNFHAPPDVAEHLGDLTEAHIGRRIAIMFEDRVISAPRVQSRIGHSGRITGAFTQQDAERIAASGRCHAVQEQEIHWNDNDDNPFIREIRTITAWGGNNGRQIIDFVSQLEALRGPVALRGDSHHAGMQIRLADEVSEHQETTEFILPEGAERLSNDEVSGAWWATCSAEVGGRRYWVQHMTPPDHPGGEPLYSIRAYARFGAFTEPDIDPEEPLIIRHRIVVSEEELTQEDSAALYQEYIRNEIP